MYILEFIESHTKKKTCYSVRSLLFQESVDVHVSSYFVYNISSLFLAKATNVGIQQISGLAKKKKKTCVQHP